MKVQLEKMDIYHKKGATKIRSNLRPAVRNKFYKMLRFIPAPVHFTNLERGGSVLPEKMNHLTTA